MSLLHSCKSNLTISTTHRLWEIKILNLLNPANATTTGRFNIIITNSDFLLRTWTSTHNQINPKISLQYQKMPSNSSLNDDILRYSRGLKFEGSLLKFNVVMNNDNTMTIKSGRFSEQTLKVIFDPSLSSRITEYSEIQLNHPHLCLS